MSILGQGKDSAGGNENKPHEHASDGKCCQKDGDSNDPPIFAATKSG